MSGVSDKLSMLADDEESKDPPPYTWYTSIGGQSLSEKESVDSTVVKVYTRRWYILAVFSILACHQCIVWNTWGPIESGAEFAFGWSKSVVPMFANWGTIMFVLSAVPLTKLVEIDIRKTVVLVAALVLVGTVLRLCRIIFPKNPNIFLISCHACAILNGISGVTIMAAPPLISSAWFPPSERTTATAINQASNMLGNGVSMLLGPALVNYSPTDNNSTGNNNTTSPLLFEPLYWSGNSSKSSRGEEQEAVKASIDLYMEILAAVSGVIFAALLIYFPSRPAHPPAPSSAVERTEFLAGIKALATNKDVLLISFAYSISQGVMGSWLGVMVNQIKPLHYNDQEIGMMGLASVVSQCIMSIGMSWLSDRLRHKMKVTILVLLLISATGFTWLMLMCMELLPQTKITLYAAIILATSVSFSTCPLFFEMTAELAYPVNEGAVGGFLTAIYNFVGILFLFLFFIPSLTRGKDIWISYTLVGSTIAAIPATALVTENYNRSNADKELES